MKVVLQRVRHARVRIQERVVGEIARGLLVFVGIGQTDTATEGEWLARKIASLRVFPDEAGQMNRSVKEIGGGILIVSQFTLYGDTRKGTRPSFNDAAKPEVARTLYETFLRQVATEHGQPIAAGEFGADMQVELVNDGPVTLVIDSPAKSPQ